MKNQSNWLKYSYLVMGAILICLMICLETISPRLEIMGFEVLGIIFLSFYFIAEYFRISERILLNPKQGVVRIVFFLILIYSFFQSWDLVIFLSELLLFISVILDLTLTLED